MRRLPAVLSLLILFSSGAAAQMRLEALRADLGVIYVPNLDPNKEPPDLITYVLGAGLILPFAPDSAWSFEPSADVYTNYYELDPLGRAVPTTVEERSAFVLGMIVDTPIAFSFRFGEGKKWRLGLGAGLGFDLRVGFLAAPEGEPDLGAINSYFWKEGRFFMPSTFLRGEYKLTEMADFGFAVRAYWPIFNFWADEGLPFMDQSITCVSLGIRYKVEARSPRPSPDDPVSP